MGQYFGTDGIRGVANKEVTCEIAYKTGIALRGLLQGKAPRVLIACDTRVSGGMLLFSLAAGCSAAGIAVDVMGIAPTPAAAHLTVACGYDAGIVISASHNKMEYNGIKLFKADGQKLADAEEAFIEQVLASTVVSALVTGSKVGKITSRPDLLTVYCNALKARYPYSGKRHRILIDTANGAAYITAKYLFPKADFLFDKPDGCNINDGCGSTDMAALSNAVTSGHYALGIAFDGDADRCLMVDAKGRLISGDKIGGALAAYRKRQGKLNGNALVCTIVSGTGLLEFAKEQDIAVIKTAVGDKFVIEEMLRQNLSIGFENAGHIVLNEGVPIGDGQAAALYFLSILEEEKITAEQLTADIKEYPQVQRAILVSDEGRKCFLESPALFTLAAELEKRYNVRSILRLSGTEPVVRIVTEGAKETAAIAAADALEAAVKAACQSN